MAGPVFDRLRDALRTPHGRDAARRVAATVACEFADTGK
eukprot:gene13758-5375_t